MAAVAKMGYDGVEFAGYYGRSAKELRKMLDDLKLKAFSTHIGVECYIIEQESYPEPLTRLRCVEKCLQNFRKLHG